VSERIDDAARAAARRELRKSGKYQWLWTIAGAVALGLITMLAVVIVGVIVHTAVVLFLLGWSWV
jgi:hypothetical protein